MQVLTPETRRLPFPCIAIPRQRRSRRPSLRAGRPSERMPSAAWRTPIQKHPPSPNQADLTTFTRIQHRSACMCVCLSDTRVMCKYGRTDRDAFIYLFIYLFIRSPVPFYFFPQLTFSDVCKPIFSKLFQMTWLYSKKKRCYTDFLKVPLTKIRGENPQILPNLVSNRNILCTVTRNVEGK